MTRAISQIEIENLPHSKKAGTKRLTSACPFCLDGKDRFVFWPDKGNWWCNHCHKKGFVTDAPNSLQFSPEQIEAWQRAEERRKQKEKEAKLSALERLALGGADKRYHHQMVDRTYFYNQGLLDATINFYHLGYCPACPTSPDSPSYTIPIYYQEKLYNIRHRLVTPNGKGKYRPEMAGLPAALFNADLLIRPEWMTVLVEGEVKSMVLCQAGFSTIGVPGASSFKEKWAALFARCGIVFVAFDPGAEAGAGRTAEMLQGVVEEVRICQLPAKPDDMLVKYGGTAAELFGFLMQGRKI